MPPAPKNYIIRKYAPSCHHPAISRCRGGGTCRFHTLAARDERALAALGRGAGRNAGAGAPPACARASGRVLGTLFTPWCPPPAARRARHPSRAPCARQEDEVFVDLAGVPGDTRERRRPATARVPRDRYGAGLSGGGARLASKKKLVLLRTRI
jgi:hypothetical protein